MDRWRTIFQQDNIIYLQQVVAMPGEMAWQGRVSSAGSTLRCGSSRQGNTFLALTGNRKVVASMWLWPSSSACRQASHATATCLTPLLHAVTGTHSRPHTSGHPNLPFQPAIPNCHPNMPSQYAIPTCHPNMPSQHAIPTCLYLPQ